MEKNLGLHNHIVEQGSNTKFLQECEEQNANVISITDHRTLISYYNLFSNLTKEEREKFKNLRFILGMELTGMFNYKTITNKDSAIPMDILAYNIDVKKYSKLYKFINEKYNNLDYMNSSEYQKKELEYLIKIARQLGFKADYDNMKIDDKNRFSSSTLSYGLIDKKYLEHNLKNGLSPELITNPRGFKNRELKNPESKFYINQSKFYPNIEDVISKIHETSGLAFVPHTAAYFSKSGNNESIKRAWDNSYKLTQDFLNMNSTVDGIEIKHPAYLDNKEFYEFLVELSKKKNLYVSGGTDYHKPNEPITKDYDGNYITDSILYNFNDWAKLYTVDEIIELGKEIFNIENSNEEKKYKR